MSFSQQRPAVVAAAYRENLQEVGKPGITDGFAELFRNSAGISAELPAEIRLIALPRLRDSSNFLCKTIADVFLQGIVSVTHYKTRIQCE